MKLITLNTWGGQVFKPLKQFVHQNAGNVDIFCFQEVFRTTSDRREKDGARINLLMDIEELLTNYNYYFATKSTGYDFVGEVDFHLEFGITIFIKKAFKVTNDGDIFEANNMYFRKKSATTGKAQFITFEDKGTQVTLCNMHGLWNGGGKSDAPERIEQSNRIKLFMDSVQGKKILCGDFNLLPETESIKILEKGMKNLIKDSGVVSTRSSLYPKEVKFADYILISPDINVKDFKVLQDVVSDHLPLYLEFE